VRCRVGWLGTVHVMLFALIVFVDLWISFIMILNFK